MDEMDDEEIEIFGDEDDNSDIDEDFDALNFSDSSTDDDNELTSELDTTETETETETKYEDSEDIDEDEESSSRDRWKFLKADPPKVFERSLIIERCPGIPDLMKHRGYRLCGDNIDKNVYTRHMRIDHRNKSLHYFHMYAVENRVHFSELSEECPDNSHVLDFQSVAKSLLPSSRDDSTLKKNIAILISRVLCKYLKFFKLSFDDVVKKHIQHRYYEEMSSKSSVVCSVELNCD